MSSDTASHSQCALKGVRVIDLTKGGTITEVKVQTGLTEGSYIEISKGLRGNESVVVETDEDQ